MGFSINADLKTAISKFQDKTIPATVTICEYISKEYGFIILPDDAEKKEIEVSFHFQTDLNKDSFKNYSNISAVCTAKKPLFEKDSGKVALIEYDGIKIAAYRQTGYNPEANIYTYDCETTNPYNDGFIVKTVAEIQDELTGNSTLVLLQFGERYNIDIFPSKLGKPNSTAKQIFFEIVSTQTMTPPQQIDDNTTRFFGIDEIDFYLVNYNRAEEFEFCRKLIEQHDFYNFFGVMTNPEFADIRESQKSFGFVSNVKKVRVKINYSVDSTPADVLKSIIAADFAARSF